MSGFPGLGCGLCQRHAPHAGSARCRGGRQVDACQRLSMRRAQVHHARLRDSIDLPRADAGLRQAEDPRDGRGSAERVNYLGCGGVHAHMLDQANNKRKPKLTRK